MAITDGLITLNQGRASIYGERASTAPTTNDADIEAYIEAITPLFEDECGPLIARTGVTHVANGGGNAIRLPSRFNAITSVTANGVAWSSGSWVEDPDTGIIYAGADGYSEFPEGRRNVTIVYTVGSATIPKNVQLAAREILRLWWQVGRQANRPGTAEQGGPGEVPMGIRKRVTELLAPNARVAGFA